MMQDELSLAKRKKQFKRKLTGFLCREMLYDFLTQNLDEERHQAVEEFLKNDKECLDDLATLQKGMDYSQLLFQARISHELESRLLGAESLFTLSRRYAKWSHWPETLRWSLTALAISTSVAAIVAFIPWNHLPSLKSARDQNTVVLTEIPNEKVQKLAETQEANEVDPAELPNEGSGDAEMGDNSGDSEGDSGDPKVAAAQVHAAQVRQPAPTHAVHEPAKAASQAEPIEEISQKIDDSKTHDGKKPKSFVYRVFMTLPNALEVAPQIAVQIRELGGEKAGEVDLGWRKGNGSYFHFTLPESNEQKILEKLRAYGPVRISKDPHPRVMPAGQVRFILWVDSSEAPGN